MGTMVIVCAMHRFRVQRACEKRVVSMPQSRRNPDADASEPRVLKAYVFSLYSYARVEFYSSVDGPESYFF